MGTLVSVLLPDMVVGALVPFVYVGAAYCLGASFLGASSYLGAAAFSSVFFGSSGFFSSFFGSSFFSDFLSSFSVGLAFYLIIIGYKWVTYCLSFISPLAISINFKELCINCYSVSFSSKIFLNNSSLRRSDIHVNLISLNNSHNFICFYKITLLYCQTALV